MKETRFGEREIIYSLVRRSQRFHAPVSTGWEYDVTDTLEALRSARRGGRRVGLTAYLILATARLLEEYPGLNRHLFHSGFRKRLVQFNSIHCTVIVQRRNDQGEKALYPLLLRHVNNLTMEQIQRTLRHARTAPLSDLPDFQRVDRLRSLPPWILRLVSWRTRSSPSFYSNLYGTYGISPVAGVGKGPISFHAYANTAVAFFPGFVERKPVARHGKVEIRRLLGVGMICDHFIVDGQEMLSAARTLQRWVESGELLQEENP